MILSRYMPRSFGASSFWAERGVHSTMPIVTDRRFDRGPIQGRAVAFVG
jgi:hypothetical protein